METFVCPKCKTGELGEPNEKNVVACTNPACRRCWRLMPDRQSIMGANTVLRVDNAEHKSTAPNVGGHNG